MSRLLIWFVINLWKDDDEVLNIWKSYMWTAEWRIKQRMIIAVIYATFAVAGLYKIRTVDLCNTNKLVSLIGRALHRYAEVKGLNPVQAWILFRLSFCNCKSCVYNCDDHPSFKNRIMRPKKKRQEKKKITTGHPPVPDHLNRINLSWDIRKGFCKDLQEKYCELLS